MFRPCVVRPLGEDLLEQTVELGAEAGQGGPLQSVQRGHVHRAPGVGEVVEMLDQHTHDLQRVGLHGQKSNKKETTELI